MSENTLKYNIQSLEWQQFEILAFKCLQFDISKSISFLEGGNDKGRDFIYEGSTNFFNKGESPKKYIFQAKHKSNIDSFKDLKKDLKKELEKVYIENKLNYNSYCLVTNITISGNQYDELESIFNNFLEQNKLDFDVCFNLYSYRHIESCIDINNSLKWNFPSIIQNTDFKFLLNNLFNKSEKNITKGWLKVFKKNKSQFVYTNIYGEALNKLKGNHVLLLSGPPKSGKTFNAEMLLFNSFCSESFIPYKIDKIEDFEKIYDAEKKQIFLFDDAFGKHNINVYKAESFDRKLEYIFELIDENHKCIFTSREYIVKAFIDYSDADFNKIIEKINVEISRLSLTENESLFRRYFCVYTPDSEMVNSIMLDLILKHKNYSPETIRAYFQNTSQFIIKEFLEHLNLPDKYLEKVFNNLTEEKKMVLLSVLFSLDNEESTISYSYKNISNDLEIKPLIALKNELQLMEGSIIKKETSFYDFYHPSMFDFFVNYLSKDIAVYREVLFKNLNLKLLDLIIFSEDKRGIAITTNDFEYLNEGMSRIISNPQCTISNINHIFLWEKKTDCQLNFKVLLKKQFQVYRNNLIDSLNLYDYTSLKKYNVDSLGLFFEHILPLKERLNIEESILIEILKLKEKEPKYWFLVFRITPFLKKSFLIDNKDWLNNFYLSLKREIDTLGKELYGDAYPNFPEVMEYKAKYNEFVEHKKKKEALKLKAITRSDYKKATNESWYPRYRECQQKISVIKSSQPYGYKIYQKLEELFGHLRIFEENQRRRYNFNRHKKWWGNN